MKGPCPVSGSIKCLHKSGKAIDFLFLKGDYDPDMNKTSLIFRLAVFLSFGVSSMANAGDAVAKDDFASGQLSKEWATSVRKTG